MTPQLLVTILVFAPLIGAIIAGLFGRRIGNVPSQAVTTGLLLLACLLSWITFAGFLTGSASKFTVELMPFINVGDFKSTWSIRVDTLSAVMLVVVTSVSSLVHIYSWGYMAEDDSKPRFFAYLSLFTFAMLALVTAADFMQLFFGWEGVGLASYLLIGFWFKKPTANAASIKAFVVNRVGDFGFALGIMTVFWMFGTINFAQLFPMVAGKASMGWEFLGHTWHAVDLACLLLFVGAMGKSAQFFLHTWLPDAMEGPTPVSALIHAATMVTAGVYMVCLLSPMFEYAPVAKQIVTLIGAVTALFAATVGLAQNDIKRVIAYSTCSQLGYMFFAAGVGAYQGAMFHLFTHAFFKALLFLGAGSVIHGMHHEQDMRKMGGLWKLLPVTYAVMMIGTIAITGFGIPGLDLGFAGFYSKDFIIEAAWAAGQHNAIAQFAFIVGLLAAGLTSFYSFRLIFMTFHGTAKWGHDAHHAEVHGHDDHHAPAVSAAEAHEEAAHAEPDHGHGHDHKPHESPLVMLVPLLLLAVGAIAAGYAFVELFVGHEQAEFLARRGVQRRHQPRAARSPRGPAMGHPGAADRLGHRPDRRLVRLCPERGHGRADRGGEGASVALLLQQVVLRRAVQRHLRPRGQVPGRRVLEVRRSEDHRRPGPRRRVGPLQRGGQAHRSSPDRLRLPLCICHVAGHRGSSDLRPLPVQPVRRGL